MRYRVTDKFPKDNQYGYQPGQIVERMPDDLTARYVAKGYLVPADMQDQKADKQQKRARVK